MKRLLYILTAALMASACGEEKNEVFYTISYPITEVGAEVTIETTEPEPEPTPGEGGETGGSDTTGGTGTDEGTGSGSETEDETGDGTGEGGQTEDPAVAEIEAEIIAAAPVAAGGSYTLYFSTYNAGRLEVMTAADAAMAAGVFGKEPGQSSIEFIYSERDYVCTVSSYTDSEGVRKVLLAVDLTEEYRKLHPEVNITKAERLEYTSTNAY
ncbi:hypothetical protein [uncultured Alistipes sp.]|jgi:hypothetical protein|uniref:hypothetical protein n=1 Tax=uncultured Alistipes sp. TaxID=538949 RepID=UPI00266608ED|nr:hypothetical protein [uncultured Alistipes sp.]